MMSALVLAFSALFSGRGQEPPAPAPAAQRPRESKVERVTLPRKHAPLFMELLLADPEPATPLLVLFHQARSSKGEYRPMAPHLKELGYNTLAVDLCCGSVCREVRNLTAKNASDGGRNPTYLDALPDMLDAILWAREKHAHGKLVVWGSSYSASLALHVAAEHPDLVDGVIAFSPGEYFTALGKSASWIREQAPKVECPVFVSSARSEEAEWKPIFEALASPLKTSFLPSVAGAHGSPALWDESAGHAEYWAALEAFLEQHFPVSVSTPPKDG